MARLLRTMPEYNYHTVPSRGLSGGLCMAWDNSVKVDILNSCLSYICARIQTKDKPPWVLVGVYGDSKHTTNQWLWETLKQLIHLHGAVCIMGDFNEIASSQEKYGGSSTTKPHTVQFQNFIFDSGLVDVGYKGPAFTWTNKRHVSNAIFQRLDRVLVTADWLDMYPNAYVNHLPMIHSDHCPILFRIKKPPQKSCVFRMENWWLMDQSFKDNWIQKWNSLSNVTWQYRWQEVQSTMHNWATSNPTPKQKLQKIERQLLHVQSQHPAIRDHALEEDLLKEYEFAEEQHSQYWRQRSRLQWQHEGDRNTRFFHTVATNRRRHNLITMVKKDDDQLTGDEKVIREKFIAYFKNLYCPTPNAHDQQSAREEVFEVLNQRPWPKIPNLAHQRLIQVPSVHEIKRAVFNLGPDKSPGPDGLTARFIQQNWIVVGPEICAQIKSIFLQDEIPQDWLRCRVTLIPKTNEPQTPAEFRPISVGNLLYRLVMKIIAVRLQPSLKTVIAEEQNAFVKGRSIAENIILVKEILHSFSLTGFKQKAFLLKADVNKAFDKLNWQFLSMAMEYLNIPRKIINIVTSSYCRAQVTININGRGDGFLTPTQGVRQGCPMSPYVFIISMEVLSRMIKVASQSGLIKGVKVAATSPNLTHAIYADDLVIMGAADVIEVQTLTSIMQTFGSISGLHINPSKSRLWFSKSCDTQTTQIVQQAWGAQEVEGVEKYLGVFLNKRGDIRRNGRLLLEKMKSKLSGWKAHMLSHAGRLVLIKSVLMSMPVYAMSLELLPKGIIKEIDSLLAKFLWGKTGKDRYLSFIAWKKVCKPLEEGGLGVKNLQCFGEALFLKLVWSLMADDNKPWVQLCKAKYFPVIGYWRAKRNGGCSTMWGQVLKLRSFFKEQVQWQIGNGEKVQALSQPWFHNWSVQDEASRADRKIKVCELWDNEQNCWRTDELDRLFPAHQVQQIMAGQNKPQHGQQQRDKLVWFHNNKGTYTVKEGYKEIIARQERTGTTQQFDWQQIWRWKKISPKIKVFLWRLVHRGLPMAANMHSRLTNFSATCQRCGLENEFEMHCIFFCETSRQVWFGSPLGIRVHDLPLDIARTIEHIMAGFDEDGAQLFAITMWEIWKERNKTVIEHEVFQVRKVLQRINVAMTSAATTPFSSPVVVNQREHEKYEYLLQGWQILTDASWQVGGRSGGAFVVYKGGELYSVGLHWYMAHDPFHAEAITLNEAMGYVYDSLKLPADTRVQFFSDCLNLVQAVGLADNSDLPSWRALTVINNAIMRVQEAQDMATVQHVSREALHQAHILANTARRNMMNYRGPPFMALQQQGKINRMIDENFFMRVQEAPP